MRHISHPIKVVSTAAIIFLTITACGSPSSPTADPRSIVNPPTLRPIVSPTPAASPTPAPSPTPTPDPRLVIIGTDVNPLTGEKVPDPSVLNRRPLAIKIGDSIEPGVRPQGGASFADWVIEHESEGGIPRWTAVFYGQTPQRVGGTRSCRIIDTEIPAIFKALLACSGMSGGTREFYIKPSDFNQEHRFFSPDFGDWHPMFYRLETAPIPHNMFVDPTEIWKEADKRGANTRPDLSGLVFSTVPITPGQPATEIMLKYGSETERWKYDRQTTACSSLGGCYLRWSAGAPHTDSLNGQQLNAANVIVVYVNHVEDKRYLEEDYVTVKAYGIQIQWWLSGPVKIFRDGLEFDGTWNRFNRGDMVTYKDANGNPLPLKPGKTWVELVRLDAKIDVTP